MRFRCLQCKSEFEDKDVCIKCSAQGHMLIIPLNDVHLLAHDPSGPILGDKGLRYRIACQPKREMLAMHPHDEFAATEDPRVSTCPSCKTTTAWREAASQFEELRGLIHVSGQ